MRLIFAGTPRLAVPVVQRLSEHHDIVAVLTRPPSPQGRSSRLVPSPVQEWADARGVTVIAPATLRDPAVVRVMRDLAPDCCPVVAYGGLVTRELLAVPRWGWINLHFSLLPAYRGAAPVQRALLDGCEQTGLTTFRLVPALDAGPVFLQRELSIGPAETAGDLLERLVPLGAGAMVATLDLVERGVEPSEQPAGGVSLAPKLTVDEARLNFARSARDAVNRVRAMSPEPGAWALLGGQRFKVLRAMMADGPGAVGPVEAIPGRLRATKAHLFCRAGDGWVDLVEVQAVGRKAMPGADWARGAWHEGDHLE